jgi:hypothetical protein
MSVGLEAPARVDLGGEQVLFICGVTLHFSLADLISEPTGSALDRTVLCAFAFD